MKIFLQSLKLTNFKGIRELVATFNQVTNISGQNATGKTTLMDAFLWLFFGKDSTDRKDFEIKTLDENNKPYQRLDHEVEGVLIVDGNELTLRRCYKEKWTKKRGSSEHEFTGHETSYFWNDVPLQQKEYEQKIASLFNENIFKLITNTTYFNSLKWQDRRAVLMQIAGKIDDTEVLERIATVSNKAEVLQITNALNQGKTIDEFKNQLAAKRKKLKDELALASFQDR
jgi:exonuclease SbcC